MIQSAKQHFVPPLLVLNFVGLISMYEASTLSALADASAQRAQPRPTASQTRVGGPAKIEDEPTYRAYKDVRIGMQVEEVRKKLGEPADKGDTQDFYTFSENETAQIFYDGSHMVEAISVSYFGTPSNAPSPQAVLGIAVEANADGSMHKRVQYEKEGYWVSYSRTAGDNPMINVAMQKIKEMARP